MPGAAMAAAMVGAGFKPAHTHEMHHTRRIPMWQPKAESRAGIDRHEKTLGTAQKNDNAEMIMQKCKLQKCKLQKCKLQIAEMIMKK